MQVKTNHPNIQTINLNIFVEGRVQGVGYRKFAYSEAKNLQLSGWVRNNLDGRVELMVTFRGEGAESQKEQLLRALEKGPVFSKVRGLKVAEVENEFSGDFYIAPDEPVLK